MASYEAFDPPYRDPAYSVTLLRAPVHPPVPLRGDWLDEIGGPVFDSIVPGPLDYDLTRHHASAPLGERVIIFGRISDSDGRAVTNTLVEIWQANGAGRYVDQMDLWGLPLDPNFTGTGRCLTDENGFYRFVTIKPARYPAPYAPDNMGWRASHVHFSLFGPAIGSRLITQMYFEGDPFLRQDAIFHGIQSPRARDLLVAKLDLEQSVVDTENTLMPSGPDARGRLSNSRVDQHTALLQNQSTTAYRFDIVLRGRRNAVRDPARTSIVTPSQTSGPLFGFALFPVPLSSTPADHGRSVEISGRILDGQHQPLAMEALVEVWSDGQACRAKTDAQGVYRISMRKPAGGTNGLAPALNIFVFARGLARQLFTRLYFPEESPANAADPILGLVEPTRRETLVAKPGPTPESLRFDVVLQGADETVFLAV